MKKWVRFFCFINENTGKFVNDAGALEIFKSAGQSRNISKVSTRNDNPVWDFPAKSLANFESNCFLSFDAKAIFRVG